VVYLFLLAVKFIYVFAKQPRLSMFVNAVNLQKLNLCSLLFFLTVFIIIMRTLCPPLCIVTRAASTTRGPARTLEGLRTHSATARPAEAAHWRRTARGATHPDAPRTPSHTLATTHLGIFSCPCGSQRPCAAPVDCRDVDVRGCCVSRRHGVFLLLSPLE